MPDLNPRPCCYTDKKGRTWDLSIDFAVCRRVDAFDKTAVIKESFSLLAPDKTLLHRILYTDRAALFALIWAIVVEQAQELHDKYNPDPNGYQPFPSPKESPEAAELEFVSGVNGPVIEAARIALSEALGDFFPELRIALSTWATQTAEIQEKVAEKIKEVNPVVMQMVDEEFDKLIEKMKDRLKTQSERLGVPLGPLLPIPESPTSGSMLLVTPGNGSSSLTTPNS